MSNVSMEPVAFVCAPSDSSPISMTCPVKSLDILATMHNAPLYTAAQLAAARLQGAEEERAKLNLGRQTITEPADIRRVFELDDATWPDPDTGFSKLGDL